MSLLITDMIDNMKKEYLIKSEEYFNMTLEFESIKKDLSSADINIKLYEDSQLYDELKVLKEDIINLIIIYNKTKETE